MRGPGRPQLPEREARGAMIGVHVTPDEKALIRKAAELAGRTASDWARQILVDAARKRAVGGAPPHAAQSSKARPKSKSR